MSCSSLHILSVGHFDDFWNSKRFVQFVFHSTHIRSRGEFLAIFLWSFVGNRRNKIQSTSTTYAGASRETPSPPLIDPREMHCKIVTSFIPFNYYGDYVIWKLLVNQYHRMSFFFTFSIRTHAHFTPQKMCRSSDNFISTLHLYYYFNFICVTKYSGRIFDEFYLFYSGLELGRVEMISMHVTWQGIRVDYNIRHKKNARK